MNNREEFEAYCHRQTCVEIKDAEMAKLREELNACQRANKWHSEEIAALNADRNAGNVGLHHLKGHNDALRAELDALKSQNPVAMVVDNKTEEGGMEWLLMESDSQYRNLDFGEPLYARPVPAIPEGYALVPVEPTDEMKEAGRKELGALYGRHGAANCYKAMISAAKEQANET